MATRRRAVDDTDPSGGTPPPAAPAPAPPPPPAVELGDVRNIWTGGAPTPEQLRNWRPGDPTPPGSILDDQGNLTGYDSHHDQSSGLLEDIGSGVSNILSNTPVVGPLWDRYTDKNQDTPGDPGKIDTGLGYYGDTSGQLDRASAGFARPADNAQGAYNAAMEGANGPGYQAGQIGQVDLSGADRLTGQQDTSLGQLSEAAAGRGPSAAQDQFANALSQEKSRALSLANTSRGAGRGAARLQALSNFGQQAGAQAAQSAALRSQEQQAAQSAYSSALGTARTQDVNLATTGAQLRTSRDVFQESANREAYVATDASRRGYLGDANNANTALNTNAQGRADVARQRLALADSQAKAKQAQYDAYLSDQQRRDKKRAGEDQAALGFVSGLTA